MKTLKIKYFRVSGIGLLLLLLISCTASFAEKKTPPIPKEPISDLKQPEPIVSQVVKGEAPVPPAGKIGFELDMDNRVQTGDWEGKGRVTRVEARKVTFTTVKGKEGNLVFRWPEEFQMPLKPNEMVTIRRTAQPFQGAMENRLSIETNDKLVVSYGRVFGAVPRQVLLPKGMKIQQTKGPGRILSKSKYEITKQIPVVFAAEGRNVPLNPGKAQQVMAGRNNFKILISSSIHVAPTPAFEGVVEGSGYILEYVFIRE